MKIKVLGCYGSEIPNHHTTSFLINDTVLLDAGTVSSILTIEEQMEIKCILLSHIHFDHIKAIPFLADNRFGTGSSPIEIISQPEVIDDIQKHLLNNLIWPDFSKISDGNAPVLRFKKIPTNTKINVDGLTVEAIKVNHTVPTVGYIIRYKEQALLYTGDTSATEEIWEKGKKIQNLKAIIVETSFPNELQNLADLSRHLTPNTLKKELSKVGDLNIPILIFHMKPRYLEKIKQEIKQLNNKNIQIMEEGTVFELSHI